MQFDVIINILAKADLNVDKEIETAKQIEDIGAVITNEEQETVGVNGIEENVQQTEPNVRTSGKKKDHNEEPSDCKPIRMYCMCIQLYIS